MQFWSGLLIGLVVAAGAVAVYHIYSAKIVRAVKAERDEWKLKVENLAKLPETEFANWKKRFAAVATILEGK